MPRWLKFATILGPGILVAATGVGAGDLAAATLAGSRLGVAILWAVLVGAFFKFVLNEGLARYQLATNATLLEGVGKQLGRVFVGIFLAYLVVWSFLVSMALMNTCGVAANAILPIFEPDEARMVFGSIHSALAIGLIRLGGFQWFERFMSVCIAAMFVIVLTLAVALAPRDLSIIQGLTWPSIPLADSQGSLWTMTLLGGVGGTVTILCYGYWIRESGRHGLTSLRTCRIDLAVAYALTAIFGIAMVVIGSQLGTVSGKGAGLVVNVADQLHNRILRNEMETLATWAKWSFLLGAWAAFFSSLLGVWQSVPYLFEDSIKMLTKQTSDEQKSTPEHRGPSRTYYVALLSIGLIPLLGLKFVDFSTAIMIYGVVGALFMPLLAIALLLLNGRERFVGKAKNRMLTTLILVVILIFFLQASGIAIYQKLFTSS